MTPEKLPRFLPELLCLQIPQHVLSDAHDEVALGQLRRSQTQALLELLEQFQGLSDKYEHLRHSQPVRAQAYLAQELSDCLAGIEQCRRTVFDYHHACGDAACAAQREALTSAVKRNIYRINDAYSPTPISPLRLEEFAYDPRQSRLSSWTQLEDDAFIRQLTG